MIICETCKKDISKEIRFICCNCKVKLCESHTYYYVDGNNICITNNSLPYCKSCYKKKYGDD